MRSDGTWEDFWRYETWRTCPSQPNEYLYPLNPYEDSKSGNRRTEMQNILGR